MIVWYVCLYNRIDNRFCDRQFLCPMRIFIFRTGRCAVEEQRKELNFPSDFQAILKLQRSE